MWGEKEKRGKHFLLPMQEMGVKTQNGGLHLLVLLSKLEEYRWSLCWICVAKMGAKTGRRHPDLLKSQGQLVCFWSSLC
jgi:hypothetical protein